jgi:glycosyltransferase involved in cell wall biosynthesis
VHRCIPTEACIADTEPHSDKRVSSKRTLIAGALVPFEDPAAIADTAIELLDNDAARQAMRKRAYLYACHTVLDRVARSYYAGLRTSLR